MATTNATTTRASKQAVEAGQARLADLTQAETIALHAQHQFRSTAATFVASARWLARNLNKAADRVEASIAAGDFQQAYLGTAAVCSGSLYDDVQHGAVAMATLHAVLETIEIR